MSPRQIHFAYLHPTFGTTKAPKAPHHWEESVYYWWWAYLRKHDGYLACCEAGGKGRLASLYQDFGDVRSDNFKAWWKSDNRGERLFGEPEALLTLKVLGRGEPAPSHPDMLTLALPLTMPRRDLQKRLNQILKKHHLGKAGRQAAKESKAKYAVTGQPNVKALKLAFQVYQYKQENQTKKLWEIGQEVAGVLREHKIKASDNKHERQYKKQLLSVKVSNYLKKACAAIDRVGQGLSPVVPTAPKRDRESLPKEFGGLT